MSAIFKCNDGNEHDFDSNTESEYCAKGCGEKWAIYAIKKLGADLKEKDAAVEQLKAENFDLQVQLDQAIDPVHCNLCGSCGIDMCCKAHGCAHPSIKSDTLKELGDDVKELLAEITALKSKLKIAVEALKQYGGASVYVASEDCNISVAQRALKEIGEL